MKIGELVERRHCENKCKSCGKPGVEYVSLLSVQLPLDAPKRGLSRPEFNCAECTNLILSFTMFDRVMPNGFIA
jgi:hypothetical protein